MANDFDVIVVGGGGAGLSAALMAHKAGAAVMILEADTRLGGATFLAGGVLYGAGTSVQRKRGIDDNANDMYDYVMTVNQWALNPRLTRILCDQAGPAIEWLIELGADFPPEWLVCSGVDTVARGHPTRGAGGGVADVLINAAGAKGIDTALATRVESLIVEKGRVCGVRAAGMELRSSAVVITTGGFGNNPELIKRLLPGMAVHGDRVYAVHFPAPFILGDGLLMAEKIGANIVGFDECLPNPSSGFAKVVEAFMPPWLVMVNKRGRRFVAEYAPYTIFGYLINEQPESRAWAIFDEPTLVEAGNDARYSDPYNAGIATPTWEEPMIRQKVREGVVQTADTLKELAAKVGIDSVALEATVARYNADVPGGVDTEFNKKATKLFAVKKPPFYAVEVRGSCIGLTACGLEIDQHANVLDSHGIPIPGLYAGGEVLGGTQGRRYAGGGMSITNAIVFGRIAGTSAAHFNGVRVD
jgi:fumarate reductase flavoprotein subunit